MARYPGNFTDSDVLNVPRNLRVRPDTPMVELAYVTPQEQGILQALKPGTPHKGPMGIPNYDELDYLPPATSGGSWMNTPSGGEQQTQPQNVHQQAAQSMQQAGLSGVGDISSTTQEGQQAVKDYYEEREQETGQQMPQQIQDIISQTPTVQGIEVIPKAIKEKFIDPILKSDFAKDAWNTLKNVGGVFGAIPVAFFKKLAHPEMEDFKDPKFLAVINRLFEEKNKELGVEGGEKFKRNYVDDYKKLMDEAFAGNEAMIAQGLSSEEFFNQQLGEASDLSEMGELGKGSQRINFPKEYYLDDGERGTMPQTTGELENLAGLDASQYAGTDLAQMIFDARNELDKQTGGGGGAGIPSLPIPTPTPGMPDDMDVSNQTFKPGVDPDNPYGLPEEYMGWYDSPFNIPGAGGAVVVPITLPDGTVVNMPDTHTGSQFQQYLDSLGGTTAAATTPTPFDYSRWPQFGPAGGPVPNYVNQGLGQGPQFNYWNQIANAFPGMR